MRTITVKGVGSASTRPDYITLSMTIEEIATDYSDATENAAHRIELLHHVAIRNGCKKEDIKTTDFHVDTRYETVKDKQGNYRQEFVGYACYHHLKWSFDFDSKQLARVLCAISECGAMPKLNIDFTVKNPAQVHEELLIAASKNAKEKAKILCRASDCTLGVLVHIDYNWSESSLRSRTKYNAENCLSVMSRSAAPEVEPDDIEVSDTVAFTWEIQ